MKKFALIITIVFLSCGKSENGGTQADLLIQKEQIEKQIDSLSKLLKKIENQTAGTTEKSRKKIVTTLRPKDSLFKHYIELQGIVKTDQNITIRPEMTGQITGIFVREGQRVSKGQKLMQLDDSMVQDNIAKINTQLELAKTTYERQKRLWEQKIGSEMQFLQAKTQYESLQKNKASLLTQASKLQITAPFSGIIDEIYPKKGELASPQTPVIRLVNLDHIYVEGEVTETYLPFIRRGSEAILYFPSIGKDIHSKISLVGNVINPDNRSFKIKIALSNKGHLIKPNLLADIRIADFEQQGLVIPSKLIQKDKSGNSYVFTLVKEGDLYRVKKSAVEVRNEYRNYSLIAKGLQANDIIVDKGALIVKDGDTVNVQA